MTQEELDALMAEDLSDLGNSIDSIDSIGLEEPNQKEFYKLMQNAYGNDAVDILKSRPKLNVHTINSLEVFDKRIYDTFGEAFVHDLISYNIRDYQEFLIFITIVNNNIS